MARKQGFLHLNISKTKILATLGVVAVLLLPLVSTSPAHADQFDSQINALKAQISQNQAAANQKASEANTLANKLAEINAQISTAQAALTLTSTQISQTNQQIDAQIHELDRQKSILKDNLKLIYKQGEVSPIEIIASSKDLSDFVAQQEYFSAIKKKIDANLIKINLIKKELDVKKDQLNQLSSQQQGQVNAINAQKTVQSDLLALTKGDEARYQQIVVSQSAQIETLRAQQSAILATKFGGNVSNAASCGGDYPWCGYSKDSGADTWGMLFRECVSYTAFKVHQQHLNNPTQHPYDMPHNWVGWRGPNSWDYHGNAKYWPEKARAAGIPVDGNPRPGDIAITSAGDFGHAMYVEHVLNSGSQISVSQYNFNNSGEYTTMTIPSANLTFIHF